MLNIMRIYFHETLDFSGDCLVLKLVQGLTTGRSVEALREIVSMYAFMIFCTLCCNSLTKVSVTTWNCQPVTTCGSVTDDMIVVKVLNSFSCCLYVNFLVDRCAQMTATM